MKKIKKRRNYTIMFVPDDNGKTFYFNLSRFFLRSIILFILILSMSAVFYTIYWGRLSVKVQMVDTLQEENNDLIEEKRKLYQVIHLLKRVEKNGAYLRRLAKTIGPDNIGIEVPEFSNKEENYSKLNISDFEEKDNNAESNNNFNTSIPSISPVDGWISKKFGEMDEEHKFSHKGIDFVAKEGSLIRSTAPGIVKDVLNDKYFGLLVSIDHQNGFVTRYGHCKQILVSEGDNIKRGQSIALLGNTGLSSAPHVHYEVIKDGKNVDPMKYIFDRLE